MSSSPFSQEVAVVMQICAPRTTNPNDERIARSIATAVVLLSSLDAADVIEALRHVRMDLQRRGIEMTVPSLPAEGG